MGSRIGPDYACLFVGYVEERMLSIYTGINPDLYKRYIGLLWDLKSPKVT